jgi:hypothetical protein
VLEAAYPELRGRQDFYTQVWRELYSNGFVETEVLYLAMTPEGTLQPRTSHLGNAFVRLIRGEGKTAE